MKVHCAVCGNAANGRALDVTWNTSGRLGARYQVVTCEHCGAGITHPVPLNEVLTEHYASSTYRRSGGRFFAIFDWMLMLISYWRLKAIPTGVHVQGWVGSER